MMATIPTLTTPTLTPTTLRNFEASIAGLDPEDAQLLMNPTLHNQQTGSFVPPLPTTTTITTLLTNTWNGGQISSNTNNNNNNTSYEDDEEEEMVPAPVLTNNTKKTPAKKGGGAASRRGGKRTAGGRKPRNDQNLTPEEEERRRTRRERNKQAAARCRKRRVDHTNELLQETECLEATKRQIQETITQLQSERDELEFLLQAHRNCTKLKNKQQQQIQQQQQQQPAMKRPTTLPVKSTTNNIPTTSVASLETPSNGLQLSFDLDWSDLPSNGLTPSSLLPTGMTPLITPSTANAVLSSLETPVKPPNVKMEVL